MSKNRIVLGIGIFLFCMPFLGFPSRWEFFFQIIFGIVLVAVSFSSTIKRRAAIRKPRRKRELYDANLQNTSSSSASVSNTTPLPEDGSPQEETPTQ